MTPLDAVLEARPELLEQAIEGIGPQNTLEVLTLIADTPAPSGASALCRGPQVRAWCEKQGLLDVGAVLDLDVADSGCAVLSTGSGGLAMLAHLDEVSYLLREPWGGQRWRLTPYCYHLAEDPAPARVLRFSRHGDWEEIAVGHVAVVAGRHVFNPAAATSRSSMTLQPGDRVSLASPLRHEAASGRVTGSLDNAAGVAAALMAAKVLTEARVPFSCLLTDEEEGPSGTASQTISRGAARILARVPPAPLTVAIDIHTLSENELRLTDEHRRTWGASQAEYSSGARGSVTPPQLYRGLQDLLRPLARHGIPVTENVGGYVPRSDDVVAMLHSSRVAILGYPGLNRHFDRGLPTVNLHDVVALGRALVVLATAVHLDTIPLQQ